MSNYMVKHVIYLFTNDISLILSVLQVPQQPDVFVSFSKENPEFSTVPVM